VLQLKYRSAESAKMMMHPDHCPGVPCQQRGEQRAGIGIADHHHNGTCDRAIAAQRGEQIVVQRLETAFGNGQRKIGFPEIVPKAEQDCEIADAGYRLIADER
jgi:hypothetical protein